MLNLKIDGKFIPEVLSKITRDPDPNGGNGHGYIQLGDMLVQFGGAVVKEDTTGSYNFPIPFDEKPIHFSHQLRPTERNWEDYELIYNYESRAMWAFYNVVRWYGGDIQKYMENPENDVATMIKDIELNRTEGRMTNKENYPLGGMFNNALIGLSTYMLNWYTAFDLTNIGFKYVIDHIALGNTADQKGIISYLAIGRKTERLES